MEQTTVVEMRGNLDKVYVLNPDYKLRHDIHRVILFAGSNADAGCSRGWQSFIHPLQAAMLSFFTYRRPLRRNIALLSHYFRKTEEEIGKWVEGFIENATPVYTSSRQGRINFPKRVLVEAVGGEEFRHLKANDFIWKRLDLTTRRLYSGPLLVTFMLTNRCTTRCKYCYADTHTTVGQLIPTRRIIELIDEAAYMQVQQVALMGGEVFLHPDWKVILAELVRRDVAPAFLSTKIPITERLIADLVETGYKGIVQVSLDVCDNRILKALLQVCDDYAEKMLQGLELLDQSNLNYQVATVLTSYNCDVRTLAELYAKLKELKRLRDWRIVPVSNSISKDYSEFVALKPSRTRLKRVFTQMSELVKESRFPVILGEMGIDRPYYLEEGGSRCFDGKECSALTTHLFVLPDGKVTICEQLYWNPRFVIGDVCRSGLLDVWNSERALQLYRLRRDELSAESPCKTCDLFESCFYYQNRCWSDIIKAYGEEHWDYPDPRCRRAPRMKFPLVYE